MRKAYLKCTYEPGLFNHEYMIHFDSTDQRWCWINQKDIIPLDETKGYVRCKLASEDDKESLVWINDSGDQRVSPFRVKTSDLVFKIKATQRA